LLIKGGGSQNKKQNNQSKGKNSKGGNNKGTKGGTKGKKLNLTLEMSQLTLRFQ
jgi:hypothetical protein